MGIELSIKEDLVIYEDFMKNLKILQKWCKQIM